MAIFFVVAYLEVNQLGRLCFKRLFLLSPESLISQAGKSLRRRREDAPRDGFVPLIQQRPLPTIGEALWQVLDCVPSHTPPQKPGYSLLFHAIHYQPSHDQEEISCPGWKTAKQNGAGFGNSL